MVSSTFWALPGTDHKVFYHCILKSATGTGLAGWKPAAYLYEMFSLTFHLILYHCQELPPGSRRYSFARRRFLTIPRMFKSSQQNTLHLSTIRRLSLCWKSFRWFAIFRCSAATFCLAFSQFLEPVWVSLSYFFLDRDFCRRRRRFSWIRIHRGFGISFSQSSPPIIAN